MATNWEKAPSSSKNDEEGSSSASKSKTTTIEIIRDMESFVESIPDAIRSRKTLNIEPGAYNDPVADLFRRSDLPKSEWMKYAIRDESKPYTRNLISTDDKTYTLLLLVWNPHQVSPIHNHPCDGCWLNVLQGSIYETRYDDVLNTTSHNSYRSSDETTLSYITDNMGYHRVGNDNREGEIAVTMHLYSPPFDTCRCWDDANDDPTKPREGHNINHSEYGKVVAV
jgi:cysteine dioxygenase